jgi:hypothetical protein
LTDAIEGHDLVGLGWIAPALQIQAAEQVGPEIEHAVSVS